MIISLLSLLIIGLSVFSTIGYVSAQSSYDINIPTGAASPDAPYFWQSEKDGATSGIVEILVGDEVVWKNADTATHTVTSGTPNDGPDGIFDSGLLGPGRSFHYTFSAKGNFPYYCIVHPWMTGTVIVTEGFSIIPEVGKEIDDGNTTFDVEYRFNRVLSNTVINQDKKSITFEIIGNAKSDDHHLTLRLPTALIDGPFAIWVDGNKLTNFESVHENDLTVLDIQLTKDSKLLTIVGTTIVPEFGIMGIAVFGIAILSVLGIKLQANRLRF